MDSAGNRRLQPRPPMALDANQETLYHRLVDGPRGRAGDVPLVDGTGALLGPFAVMVVAPEVGNAVQLLGAALRYESGLDPVVREAAILLVAAYHRCDFEWVAHENAARTLGLDDRQVDSLRHGTPPSGLSQTASQALLAVHSMLHTGSLDDDAYARVCAASGERGLAELIWLTGYYSMLALALAVFEPPDPLPGSRVGEVRRP